MDEQQRSGTSRMSVEEVGAEVRPSRTSTALFILIGALPIVTTILFGGVDSATWVILSVLWAAIVLLWIAESWNVGGIALNPSSLLLPLVGLLILGLVQLLPFGGGSAASVETSHAISLDPYSTRFFVIRLVIFLTFFAACLTFINSEKRLRRIVMVTVIFGAVMAFLAVLQRISNPEGIYGMRVTPQAIPFGPFVNQHHFAAFMQMTGGLALGLLLAIDVRREMKPILATAVAIMGIATLFTSSRGGLLGFAAMGASIIVMSYFATRSRSKVKSSTGVQKKLLIAAGGIALIVTVFGTVLLLGGNDQVFRGIGVVSADAGDVSTGRLHFWPIALKIFLEHPLLGAGLDAFGVAFTKFDTWNGAFRVEQAHNEYLQIMADGGIVGLACVIGFIFLLVKRGLATITSSEEYRQSAAIGALGGCIGIMVHSFFDFPLRTHSNAFFFLLLAAIATVGIATEHHGHRRHRLKR